MKYQTLLRIIFFATLWILGDSPPTFSALMRPSNNVNLQGWQVNFDDQVVTAKQAKLVRRGELYKRVGVYSIWLFRAPSNNPEETFQLILSTRTLSVLDFRFGSQIDYGPELVSSSDDGTMYLFEVNEGGSAGVIELQVWDAGGKIIFSDPGLGDDEHWEGNTLIYGFPSQKLSPDENEMTRACKSIGDAVLVKQKRFSREGIEISDVNSKIMCVN